MDLADMLSMNLQVMEQELRTFIDRKLRGLTASICQQVKIRNILTWSEAFTIFSVS